MKLKRLLTWALALTLAVPALALSASAATFPDITDHWARTYIEDMTAANMFKGYEDGTFKPENALTAAEALALCARAEGIDENTMTEISDGWEDEVDDILDGSQSWFYREFAVCLETGVLTTSELRSLAQSDALTEPIAKEDLAVYLVRAMQLGPMAERLSSYPLTFQDTSSISESKRPYVYLLKNYGIVEGDQNNDFEPDRSVTRAVMATMLSRAIDFMEERGTSPDLPDYTSYDFQQGVIASTPTESSGGALLLTLKSDLTGETIGTVSLPQDVTVYENSMETTTSALKAGRHARVCLNSGGNAYAVRVSEALEELDATVNGIEDEYLAVTADGEGYSLRMDRFTQVQIGSTVGDRSIVDASAGYTDALCKLDDQGRLVAVIFSGGTQEAEGVLAGYSQNTGTIQVTGIDGATRTYTLSDDVISTVDGMTDDVNAAYVGDFVTLRVSNDDGTVVSVAVDTETEYVQGSVKSVSYSSDTNTISVTDLDTGRSKTYKVSSGADITYNGESTPLRNIKDDYFVTLRLSGSYADMVAAYPGSTVTEGTLTGRTFDTSDATTTLEVTLSDGSRVNFKLDLSDPPDVERDGNDSSVDRLRTGDQVTVTIRYNEITKIEAEPQSANVTGTVDRIIQEKGGSTLEMTLSDGDEVSYTVSSSISVTQNGKSLSLSSIQPGYRLGLVVEDDGQVVAIEVQQAVNSSNRVSGTVIYVNTSDKYIYLQVVDEGGSEDVLTVNVPSSATILDVNTGSELYLRELDPGDVIEANGAYEDGAFTATVVLKQ
ncbi:MAG TPA: S-layer homology domain-containing protein [Candidatus Intestinimonas stercoravium]|nr:S-layer homology domain-containing protein [Candidatus Intestinimonas stercoravium]